MVSLIVCQDEAQATNDKMVKRVDTIGPMAYPARVFICCRREDARAQQIATALADEFGPQRTCFDAVSGSSTGWAERLGSELRAADVVVAILSPRTIDSELVEAELHLARELAAQTGTPRIVAVRLPTTPKLPYPLRRHVDGIAHLEYTGNANALANDIRLLLANGNDTSQAVTSATSFRGGSSLLRPLPWADPNPSAEDALAEAPFYIERDEERVMARALAGQGVTIAIKGPRQSGKSLVLSRLLGQARTHGKRAVLIDFQFQPQPAAITDFFAAFCDTLAAEFKRPAPDRARWGRLPNGSICTTFLEREILSRVEQPLVLAFDEMERIVDPKVRADFLAMLRGWHDRRARSATFRNLDLILVTALEPAQMTSDQFGSPFNVAIGEGLRDFTSEQVVQLNALYGQPFDDVQVQRLVARLGGHPFLTRRALYLA